MEKIINRLKKYQTFYKPLRLIYRFFVKFARGIDYLRLKYIFGIAQVGRNVRFDKGFKVFHGAKNINVGNNVYLTDVLLNAGDTDGSIIIEDYVFFSHKVMVIARGHDYQKLDKERQAAITEAPITIKRGAWIGAGATILKGVTIGQNAVIAAGSLVTRNVGDNTVVAGIPAKTIKYIQK
ncbi:MAG: acyltransferase [Candidatus Falkowbacteria bacterium]|nr:MAG: acyltransferase [Candidatus Falkowbacteria bacterium]